VRMKVTVAGHPNGAGAQQFAQAILASLAVV
jgi:hypothetical protein